MGSTVTYAYYIYQVPTNTIRTDTARRFVFAGLMSITMGLIMLRVFKSTAIARAAGHIGGPHERFKNTETNPGVMTARRRFGAVIMVFGRDPDTVRLVIASAFRDTSGG